MKHNNKDGYCCTVVTDGAACLTPMVRTSEKYWCCPHGHGKLHSASDVSAFKAKRETATLCAAWDRAFKYDLQLRTQGQRRRKRPGVGVGKSRDKYGRPFATRYVA